MTEKPNKPERFGYMVKDMTSLIGQREVDKILAGEGVKHSVDGLDGLKAAFYGGIDDAIRRKLEVGWGYPSAFNYATQSHPEWVVRKTARQELGYYENLADPNEEIIDFLEDKADR